MLILQTGSYHLQRVGYCGRTHLADHREVEDVLERYVRIAFKVVLLSVVGLELFVDRELNRTVRHVQHTRNEAFVETWLREMVSGRSKMNKKNW